MRKLIITLLTSLPILASAQMHFLEAPKLKRPVKQIIEWQTFPESDGEKQETQKSSVYTFRKDGKLSIWTANDYQQQEHVYHYDRKGRKSKVEMKSRNGNSEMIYAYEGNTMRAEIKEGNMYLVTTHFLNEKGQVMEEKVSGKAWFTNGKFELMSRKVLNYNKLDSLFGEMEYTYTAGIAEKRKTVHTFDPTTNRRVKTVKYSPTGKEEQVTEYLYDEAGQLASVETKRPGEDFWVKQEFQRKNGKLWQHIEHKFHAEEKYVKVFKDGHPIRYKIYIGDELIAYTDFQYIFF